MSRCWQQNPRLRPTFTHILDSIQEELRPSFRLLSFYYSPACRGARGSLLPADAEPDSSPNPKGPSLDCSPQNGGPRALRGTPSPAYRPPMGREEET